MITHVKFVSIPTGDQDRALAFWTEKVGLTLMSDQPFDDKQRWIELAVGNGPTRFVLFTPEGQAERIGSFFNGALACDDVEATTASCRSAASSSSAARRNPTGAASPSSGIRTATSSC